jgi:fructose-1,6-bisphosphatase/inositol monophosphatase family enzyme
MNEEIKIIANKTVDKIYRKVRRAYKDEFYKFGKNIGIGADGTPTKYIDKVAEDVAVKFLKKSKLKINILSEEAGIIDYGGEYTFVLDPIDGTRNAYRGIPFFSVSIGIGRSKLSDVEYGVVKNIPTGDIFIVEKGNGAYINKKRIIVPEVPPRNLLSSITLGKDFDKLSIKLTQEGNIRSLGSASLEMCMVAIGALDYYIVGKEYLRVTDIAASTLFLREAGGIVTDIRGKKLDMPLNLDERTSLVAACNKQVIKKILSLN